MEFYIVYNKNTGQEMTRGQGPFGAAASQTLLPEDMTTMVVSQAVFYSYPLDLEAIRASAAAQIDNSAEQIRLRFLTAGAGQAITYTAKVEEAKAFQANNNALTPFLSAEANAIGVTIEALATEVLAKAAEWTTIGARIEGARMGAKTQLGKAANLAEIATATEIDWATVLA